MAWLWSPFTLIVIGYVLAVVIWFALKLNRDEVVPAPDGDHGPVDAIEFFWRPG